MTNPRKRPKFAPHAAFAVLGINIALVCAVRRYRTLWREYCALADSYAGVHAGLLQVQARLLAAERERSRLMAMGLAATAAGGIEFSKS